MKVYITVILMLALSFTAHAELDEIPCSTDSDVEAYEDGYFSGLGDYATHYCTPAGDTSSLSRYEKPSTCFQFGYNDGWTDRFVCNPTTPSLKPSYCVDIPSFSCD